jgi:hypothetical protein
MALPEGFILDVQPQKAVNLPDGFVLDTAEQPKSKKNFIRKAFDAVKRDFTTDYYADDEANRFDPGALKDAPGVAAGALVSGSMGVADGVTLGLTKPLTDKARKEMPNVGLTPNPITDFAGNFGGVVAPWGAVSKGVQVASGLNNLTRAGRVATQAATGGIVSGVAAQNAGDDAVNASMAGAGIAGGIGGAFELPGVVKGSDWFRNLTIKERGLVVQDLEQVAAGLKAQGWNEGQIDAKLARLDPAYFQEQLAKRMQRPAEPVVRNTRTTEAPIAEPVVVNESTSKPVVVNETPVRAAQTIQPVAKPVTAPALIAQLEAAPAQPLPAYNPELANQSVNIPQGFVLDTPPATVKDSLTVQPEVTADVPSAQTATAPSVMATPANAQTPPVESFVSRPEQSPLLRPENQPEAAGIQPETQNQSAEYQATDLKPSVDVNRPAFTDARSTLDSEIDAAHARGELTPEFVKEKMKGLSEDRLTGFQGATFHRPTLDLAWKESQGGRDFSYADIDLANLGGLNAHAGSNSRADTHFKAIFDIVKQEVVKDAPDARFIRQGGDEGSILAPDTPREVLDKALARAHDKVQEYAVANGLHEIAHPKHKPEDPHAPGVGIHYGTADFKGAKSVHEVIELADSATASMKTRKGLDHVTRSQNETTGDRSSPTTRATRVAGESSSSRPQAGSGSQSSREPAAKSSVTPSPSSKSHADTGGYNLDPPGPQNAPFAQQKVSALQLPEIVEIAKNLMGGKYPHILRKLNKRGALGVFKTGTGSIDLIADLAKTPGLLERVLAHEVGHLVDWLPDQDIKRGNILGRIASLKKYMGSLLAEYEGAPGATLSKKDRARLRSEAEKELKANERPDETVIETITREVPQWKYTGIDSEMIKAIWNDTTARDKYPKLYRALSEMSDSEKKAVLVQAMKGLVHDRLSHMGERVQVGTETVTEEVSRTIPGIHATPKEISKRYAELVQEEISKRNLYKRDTISQELKDLTLHWKPFQPGNDPGYTAYRFSSVELYADAFSALLNDPAKVRQIAPTFEKAFMSYLNRKPEVSEIYYDIQQRLNNSDEIMQHRQENIRSMFDRGEAIKKESERKPLADIMHSLYKDLIDKNADINLKVKAVQKSGKIVEDADNPAYWVETLPYVSGEVYSHLHEIDSLILEPMKLHGLTSDDLGEYMLLKRITSDRAELANPLGHTAETAIAGLKHLEQQLGPEKWQALTEYVEKYKGIRERNVIDVVDQAEMWPDDFMQHVRDNTDYATWEVQKFIETKYGRSVSAQIYKQVGTLQEIRNPFIATVMKDAALIRAANTKIVKQKTTDFLKEHFPDEIRSADTRWNGKTHEPVEPSDPDQGMIMFPHKGEVQALYVPKGIAETFARSPYEASAILKAWQMMNIPLRAVLVNHNPLWMVANVPRDFMGTWKNTPGLSILSLLKYYGKAAPEAWADVFKGKMSAEIQGMFKDKMLVTDRQYTSIDESPDTELDRMLQQFGKSPVQYRNKVIKPFAMLWDALGNMGKFTERIGKLAGHKYLTENTDMSPEKTGHMVRSRVGTPDVHRTGRLHAITNNIFLFSNVAKEGWRASWESASESKAEYAWKTAAYNIIPKLMMAAAAAGAFGAGAKKIMDSASNYDKTNYHVIPLGFDSKGKGVYFRVPQDFTGAMAGGVLWNAMQGKLTGSKSVLSYVSEQSPYGMNPYLSAGTDIVQIMRGLNPYDDYRGKTVISEQVFKAADHRKYVEFSKHMSNSLGGSSIYRFSGDGPDKVQSELEKVLKYPGANVLGRFLKVSDQGEREQLREVTQAVAEKEARRSLDIKEAIVKDIDQQKGQPTVSDKVKLYRQLLDEKKIDIDTKFSEFRPRYERYAGKVQNNAKIDAIIDAAGVKEKSALLHSYEKTLPAAEYQKIVEQLTVEGYIKRGVFKEMALEKAGVK